MFFALLTLSVFPQPARSNEVEIRHEVGFNSVFRLNNWNPVTVFLENKGPETSGDLSIRVRSGSELDENLSETLYSKPVSLPMFASKRFSFTVFINSYSHPLIIEFAQQGKAPYRSSVNLRQHFTVNPLVVVVNTSITLPLFEHSGVNFVSTLSLHLPEKSIGYDSVEMLVVGTDVLRSLTDSQLKALQDWVKQGGTLVLTGNLNYGTIRDESVQSFIRTEVFGIETVSSLKGLKAFSGQEFLSNRPFILLKTRPKNAEVLAQENDIPIIYQRSLGFGKIIVLAFEYQQPSFATWSGWQSFWEKIYQLKPEQTSFAATFSNSSLLNALMSENPADFPSFRQTMILLFAYLFCLVIVFKYMNRDDAKGKTSLVLLIGTGTLFSVLGIWFFNNYIGEKSPTWAGLGQVKLSKHDSTALIRQFKSVMAFQKGEFQLDLDSKAQMVQLHDKGSDDVKHGILLNQIRHNNSATFPMKNWSYKFLQTDHLADLSIDSDVSFENDNLAVTFDNQSSQSFHGCYLLFKDSLLELGVIEARKKMTRLFTRVAIDQNRLVKENQVDRTPSDKIIIDRPLFFPELNRSLRKELLDSVRNSFALRKDSIILVGQMLPEKGWEKTRPGDLSGNKSIWIVEWEIPITYR